MSTYKFECPCTTCNGFPIRDETGTEQEAFVQARIADGRYRYDAQTFDLYCKECRHGGVWPHEGATDESMF
jgi:hypothetical protein